MEKQSQEHIPQNIIDSIDMGRDFSPVLLKIGDDPVKLIKTLSGYWIMRGWEEYDRDKNGNLIKINEKTARMARARYIHHS